MIDATITVVDNGLFPELAVRLAREVAVVNYYSTWEAEFPLLNDRAVADGLSHVHRIQDPYLLEIVDQTDLFAFPDILHAGKQQILKRIGKSVWGSDTGDDLETKRIWFRRFQEGLRMPVPKYQVVTGFSNLKSFLKDHGHCFIKASPNIRGSMETHEFHDIEQDDYWLEDLAVKLGGLKEYVQFLVEEPIDTGWESGIDTYCVRGHFPKTPMQGIEIKGKLLLASAQTASLTPKPYDDALSLLSPELYRRGYCNFLSAEFRGDILTDFCARAPNPGLGVEMEMISNLGEIMLAGGSGKLIEPEYEAEFGIQVAIFHDHEEDLWKQFRLPEELRRWVKLMEFCEVDGRLQIIPRRPYGQKIGWLVGIGDTFEAARKHLIENAERLEDYPFDIKLDALEEAQKQVREAEKDGFEFSDQTVPPPSVAMDND